MRKEFLIDVGEASRYNYVSGRVKVLESFFLNKDTIEKLTQSDAKEFKAILADTPYKNFIEGSNFIDIANGIFARLRYELQDMERYTSPGFINAFFRNKELFLRIKKWALIGKTEEEEPLFNDLYRFVNGSEEEFPILFREAYDKMLELKDNPLNVGAVLDIYRLKYLKDSADKTFSDLIKEYYTHYGINSIKNILYRLEQFTESHILDDKSLLSMLGLMSKMLADYPLIRDLSDIKDLDEFKEFVSSHVNSKSLAFDNKDLLKILNKGKYITIGIEVVFVYLKRLQYEVSTISMILSGKTTGMESKEIYERVSANYE
jgi:hypothetical protein